jgi:RHS repeat-associated protein
MRGLYSFNRAGSHVFIRVVSCALVFYLILSPAQPAFAAFGDGTPTVSNAQVFTDSDAPKVDGQSGAFTQRVPLDIPPGRNGLQPDVSLQYNSQNTADGVVGYGWSLSIPYIQRLNKTGSQNLYGNNPYFTSSLDGELALDGTNTLAIAATSSPSIMDTLPVTHRVSGTNVTSDSFTYTVPSGGSNKLLVVMAALGADQSSSLTATLNGATATCQKIPGSLIRAYDYYCYLAAPTSGTFSISWPTGSGFQYGIYTLQNAAQVNPIDVSYMNDLVVSGSSLTTSTTTTVGYDLLLDYVVGALVTTHTFGAGQTQTYYTGATETLGEHSESYKAASSSPRTESMVRNFSPNDNNDDLAVVAVKAWTQTVGVSTTTTYRARVDDGSHTSYSFSNNKWTVYDKKGTRYTYGSDDTGRQYDTTTGTSTQTYKWMLQEVRDTNDNYIKYTYIKDSNEMYPYTITYTGHGSTDGIDTITFATSTRPDTRISYAPKFGVTTTKRISEIDVLVNGTTVRKYPLTYGVGDNGYRSLLTSVQQEGYDDNSNLTSLPPITFTYATTSTQFYSPGQGGGQAQVWAITDTNGNGINDDNQFYHNDLSGLNEETMIIDNVTGVSGSFHPPDIWAYNSNPDGPREQGTRYLDVNGDGKADVVRGWTDNVTPANSVSFVDINQYTPANNTYSWAGTTTVGSIPTFAIKLNSGIITSGIFGDVNGDGLPDYEASLPGWVSATGYLGNGIAWDATATVFAPAKDFPAPSTGPTATASQLVDVNGDGLDDWVYSDGTNTYVLLNTGTGWQGSPSSQWTIATSSLYLSPADSNYYDRGMRFMDINGDGLPDFVRAYRNSPGSSCGNYEIADVTAVYLNTGNGWATSTAGLPAYITSCGVNGYGSPMEVYNEYGNWTGNGQMNQDVLAKVTNPKGGSTSVTYTPSAQLGTNPESPVSLLVVTQSVTNDGRGNAATTTYSYSGGKMYLASGVRDRKFAGFASATVNAPDSVTTAYFDQGDNIDTTNGEQSDGYAQINHPFRKDIYDLSSNLKQRTYSRWDAYPHGNSTFVGLGQQLTEDFASDGSHRDKAIAYQYSSTTDDVVRVTQYGEVTGNSDGTFTDITGDSRTTNIAYAASSSINMNLPVEKTVLDNNAATSSDQKVYYDALSFGQVGLGNNTRQEDWLSGTTYASSTNTFTSFGLVATSTDRRGNATSYVYDAYNLLPATTTNALLQKTQFYYNYANGKAKQSIDPNNRLTKNVFDGLGRLTEVDQSDVATPTSYATSTTYQYTDNATPPSTVRRSDWLTATNTVDTYDYSDGLGRLIQERKTSQTAGLYAAFDKIYNLAGELSSQSLPYFSSGSSFTSPTASSLLYTNYTYDSLQRMLTAGNIVGTTTNTYSKWTTTTADPNNNLKDYIFDSFGNLATVVEHNTSNATTTYTYDSLNDLATTTDGAGNVRRFTYDGLSRRLSAQDLHAPGDATFGTWSYTYDDAGNLTSQADPKSQVVNRSYDTLNRMLTEDYTGQSGTEITDTYDSCINGIGYPCTASSTSAKATNAYDILGRTSSATTTISNINYNMLYAYDRQGSVTSLTYPNSSQVTYNFNLAGLASHVLRKPSGGSFSDIISNYDYAPQGQIQNARFGNNASTTYFYNSSAMYRLSQLQTTGASSTKTQNFAYTYDPVGNITLLANTANTSAAASTAYAYDALNRLLTASAPTATSSPYSQAYTYDSLGNLLTLGTTQYATATSSAATTTPSIMDTLPVTHRVSGTSVTSDSFTYTVPSGGSNKLLVVMAALGADESSSLTATLNGATSTCQKISGSLTRAYDYYCYLAAPTSGTFSISWSTASGFQYGIYTLQNAAQANPIDTSYMSDLIVSGSSITTNVTTTVGYDLLLDYVVGSLPTTHTFGAGQTQTYYTGSGETLGEHSESYKAASSSPGTESMVRNFSPNDNNDDLAVVAVKAPGGTAFSTTTANVYTYAGTGYANPDAVTQIANGLSTTTYAYDNNGNLISAGTGAATTTYTYDYANRLTALFAGGATTTYGYDAFGQRVLQTGTTTTTFYPFKFYSVASSTGTGAKYSTTTSYMFNGDTLLATVDQQTASGIATGTATTRYVHPDHLGSTNVVTDENDNLVQTLDYFPYGATRVSVSTSTNEKRKYIDQFSDDSGLSYLNARYYNPTQGQFLSQDPMFWGDPRQQNLLDPQSLNTYSYSDDNPITKKDPSGQYVAVDARSLDRYPGTHTAFDVIPQNTSLINYSALGIPAGTKEFTIGFYAGSNGKLVPSVAYSGGSTNADVASQAMRDYNKVGLKAAYPFSGLTPESEAQAINSMALGVSSYTGNLQYPSALANFFGTGVNSNSAVNSLSSIAGLGSQFQSFRLPWFTNGSNLTLPAQSFSNPSIQRSLQITALQMQVAQLQRQITQLQTGNAKSTPQVIR